MDDLGICVDVIVKNQDTGFQVVFDGQLAEFVGVIVNLDGWPINDGRGIKETSALYVCVGHTARNSGGSKVDP